MKNSKYRGLKLFVFVDTLVHKSGRPITVICQSSRTIKDLKEKMSTDKNYLIEEQYWIMNSLYYKDETVLEDVIGKMEKTNGGYVVYLFVLSLEDRDQLPTYYANFLETRYRQEPPRWGEPEGAAVVLSKPLVENPPGFFWHCPSCTFRNRFFIPFCDACGACRPIDFLEPTDYVLSQKDAMDWKTLKDQITRDEKEQDRNRQEAAAKLRQLVQQDLIRSSTNEICLKCKKNYKPNATIILHGCSDVVCFDCIILHITNSKLAQVGCPIEKCLGVIEQREIRALLHGEDLKKYNSMCQKEVGKHIEKTDMIRCQTVNCAGQRNVTAAQANFVCAVCGTVTCIGCGVQHGQISCRNYQNGPPVQNQMKQSLNKRQAVECAACKVIVLNRTSVGVAGGVICGQCKTMLPLQG